LINKFLPLSGDFTIDTRWNLMSYTISLSSIILNGFHSYIKWRILTCTKKLVAMSDGEIWTAHGGC
jgi:hypothetical protein